MASKTKNAEKLRIQAEQKKAARKSERKWRLFLTSLFTVLAISITVLFVQTMPAKAGVGPKGTKIYQYKSGKHVAGAVKYKESPAVGGAHNPGWQPCGVYTGPISEELAVHSLEHGAVWMTYRPDITYDQLGEIRKISAGNPYILVSPRLGQKEIVIMTAWNRQLKGITSLSDPKIKRFITAFVQGPQTPEPGASCGAVPASASGVSTTGAAPAQDATAVTPAPKK